MKAVHKIVAGLAVAGFAVSAAIAARPFPRKVSTESTDGGTTAIAATAAGLNYSTGFEAPEYPLGYIAHVNGLFPLGCLDATTPCYGHTTSTACGGAGGAGCPGVVFTPSTTTPTIDDDHPATGTQHLRISTDATTRTNTPDFGLGTDARYPRNAHLSVRPVDVNTASVDVSVDAAFGSDYRIQPQSNSMGFLATSALLYNSGSIYILDDLCGGTALGFIPAGVFWDTSGGYQNYTVAMNPCGGDGTVTYSYGGAQIYAGCVIAGSNLEQFLVFGNNFPPPPGGFEGRIDLDNLVLQSGNGPCPSVCGTGVIEPPTESCEFDAAGVAFGCSPGHTCGAPGTPGQCTCDRICTLDAPCDLANGANGPFYGPFDASFGGIFIYNAPAGVDAVSVETCGSTGGIDNRIFYWGSCSDPGDPGSANDDCYPGYSGADPTASCYGTVTGPNYESCTCHDNPLDGDNCYLLQIRGGNAMVAMIEVNKKAVCGEGHLGACCDTNGADAGCTDNVFSDGCVGADKVWTENGKCVSVHCECIPLCSPGPRPCGDDGCGGSCGSCDDANACNGVETCGTNGQCVDGTPLTCNDGNACNGVETCNPSSGCVPGTPLSCSDGLACNGTETCNPSSGCVPGAAPNCDDGIECTVDSCNEPDGSCTNDDADCSIPTVSEWGLVVLTLMLLIGAKVYFGRRQAIA